MMIILLRLSNFFVWSSLVEIGLLKKKHEQMFLAESHPTHSFITFFSASLNVCTLTKSILIRLKNVRQSHFQSFKQD